MRNGEGAVDPIQHAILMLAGLPSQYVVEIPDLQAADFALHYIASRQQRTLHPCVEDTARKPVGGIKVAGSMNAFIAAIAPTGLSTR